MIHQLFLFNVYFIFSNFVCYLFYFYSFYVIQNQFLLLLLFFYSCFTVTIYIVCLYNLSSLTLTKSSIFLLNFVSQIFVFVILDGLYSPDNKDKSHTTPLFCVGKKGE